MAPRPLKRPVLHRPERRPTNARGIPPLGNARANPRQLVRYPHPQTDSFRDRCVCFQQRGDALLGRKSSHVEGVVRVLMSGLYCAGIDAVWNDRQLLCREPILRDRCLHELAGGNDGIEALVASQEALHHRFGIQQRALSERTVCASVNKHSRLASAQAFRARLPTFQSKIDGTHRFVVMKCEHDWNAASLRRANYRRRELMIDIVAMHQVGLGMID